MFKKKKKKKRYISSEDKRKTLQNQNAPKDCEIIMHRRDDGNTIQYKVVDNINKLQPQDWLDMI